MISLPLHQSRDSVFACLVLIFCLVLCHFCPTLADDSPSSSSDSSTSSSSASVHDAHGDGEDHRFVLKDTPVPDPPAAARHANHKHSHSSDSSSGGEFHDAHGDAASHAVALPGQNPSEQETHQHESGDSSQEKDGRAMQRDILRQFRNQIAEQLQKEEDPNRKIGPAGAHAHIRLTQTNIGTLIQIEQHSNNDHQRSSGEVDAVDSATGAAAPSSSASDHLIHHGSHTHTLKDAEQHSYLIFGVFFGVLIFSQVALFYWRRWYPRPYQYTTLLALWSVPLFYSLSVFDLLLFLVWFLFTAATAFVLSRAIERPLQKTTPRFVYRYFFFVYQFCYIMAYTSFLCLLTDLFGGFILFPSLASRLWSSALMALFYGLYFGVLSRDVAAYCTDQIASTLGYGREKGKKEDAKDDNDNGEMPMRNLQPHVCAICDLNLTALHGNLALASANNLVADLHRADAAAAAAAGESSLLSSLTSVWKWMNGEDEDINAIVDSEPPIALPCQHSFHLFCLKGWTMIGKKDTCPRCQEKVSMRQLFSHPWQKPSLVWSSILDVFRFIIAVNPLIILAAQFVLVLVY